MSSRQGFFAVALGMAVLAVTAGGGKRGPPLPPLRGVPAPTKALVATQRGSQIVLPFSYPRTTPAGLALPGVSAVEVLEATRQATPDGKVNPLDPKQFAATAKPRIKVAGAGPTPPPPGGRGRLSLPPPPPPPPPPAPPA